MAHENDGLETADTTPSRGRVIGLALIMYVVVACAGYFLFFSAGGGDEVLNPNRVQETRIAEIVPAYEPAAYVAPAQTRLLLPEQIAYANLRAVENLDELAALLSNHPDMRIIYVDPRMLEDFNGRWLADQALSGKSVVGLNVSHTQMADFLQVPVTMDNLTAEEERGTLVRVAAFRQADDELRTLTAAYNNFDEMWAVTNRFARQSFVEGE